MMGKRFSKSMILIVILKPTVTAPIKGKTDTTEAQIYTQQPQSGGIMPLFLALMAVNHLTRGSLILILFRNNGEGKSVRGTFL